MRSPDAFTLRRCQILLASSRGENAYQIAHQLGCNPQTARKPILAFTTKGCRSLSSRDRSVRHRHRAFAPEQAEALREMLHRSPREFGRESSLWTLEIAARLPSRRGSSKDRSRGRPSGLRSRGCWELGGCGRNAGSHLRTPCMKEKKAPRLADDGCPQPRHLGGGFHGRVLVESVGLAHPQ